MADETELLVNIANKQRAERPLDPVATGMREGMLAGQQAATVARHVRLQALERLRLRAAEDQDIADLLLVLDITVALYVPY